MVATTARRSIFGSDSGATRRGIAAGVGLFVLAGGYALASAFTSLPGDVLVAFVLLGVLLAAVAAYRRGGLLVSWLLALGPVSGSLTASGWLAVREGVAPLALPFSLVGGGAVAVWIPAALLLGTVGFAAGVLLRRVPRRPGAD